MKRGTKIYAGFAAAVLGLYVAAESFGWGLSSGKVQPDAQEQLRQSPAGSRSYVFWYHGLRGK